MKDIILEKIEYRAGTKKFYGLRLSDIQKMFPKSSANVLKRNLDSLLQEKKIKLFDDKYFTPDWKPTYTDFEIKIITFLNPVFKTGVEINFVMLKKEFFFITPQSLALILFRLEYEGKIIKRAKNAYYYTDDFDHYLSVAKNLKQFTITEFKEASGLSRKDSDLFLSFLDKKQYTNFDGTSRTFIKKDAPT